MSVTADDCMWPTTTGHGSDWYRHSDLEPGWRDPMEGTPAPAGLAAGDRIPERVEYRPAEPFRRCRYCGSIHPEDLSRAIEAGTLARIGGSDWKYGYPHKFYLGVDNPDPDTAWPGGIRVETIDGERVYTVVSMAPRPVLHAKFYTDHLEELDPQAFAYLAGLLAPLVGITFQLGKDGRVGYSAPHHGYQADWRRDGGAA